MMAYAVQQDKTCFNVVEKDSNLVIATRKVKTEATKLCQALNLGGGFAGHTPMFFTAVYPKLENS
jgi:hypothetical protein